MNATGFDLYDRSNVWTAGYSENPFQPNNYYWIINSTFSIPLGALENDLEKK